MNKIFFRKKYFFARAATQNISLSFFEEITLCNLLNFKENYILGNQTSEIITKEIMTACAKGTDDKDCKPGPTGPTLPDNTPIEGHCMVSYMLIFQIFIIIC